MISVRSVVQVDVGLLYKHGGCNSTAEYQVVVLGMKVRFLPLAHCTDPGEVAQLVRALACRASSRGFESRLSRSLLFCYFVKWGIAKLVKAVDFGSAMQRFEPFYPSGPLIAFKLNVL